MTKEARIYNREKIICSISGAGKTGKKATCKINEIRTLPNIILKNKLKMY